MKDVFQSLQQFLAALTSDEGARGVAENYAKSLYYEFKDLRDEAAAKREHLLPGLYIGVHGVSEREIEIANLLAGLETQLVESTWAYFGIEPEDDDREWFFSPAGYRADMRRLVVRVEALSGSELPPLATAA